MVASVPRYPRKSCAGRRFFGDSSQIAKRQYADQPFVPINHRNAPDLLIGKVLADFVGVLIIKAVSDFGRHDIADLRLRSLPLGNRANRDVAIVSMPTSRSLSSTGTTPASSSAMILAASSIVSPGLTSRTSRVITSLTFMIFILRLVWISTKVQRIWLGNVPSVID
ncbi:hypothetical protein AJ87_45430 [Rhizobium yanglingense]|nr:hypothetical protein AJ87_45430 [Rhizobium yanglingense]